MNRPFLALVVALLTLQACGTTSDAPPLATLSTTAVDFGFADCGGAALAPKTVLLANTAPSGAQSLSYTVTLADPTSFTITSGASGTVDAGASAQIVFAPQPMPGGAPAGQTFSTAVLVTTNDSLHPALVIALRVTAHGATFTMSPDALDFGQAPIDAFAVSLPVTVTNVGNAPADVSFIQPGDTAMAVDWKGAPGPTTVAPGDALVGAVATFHPTSPGSVATSATLKITGATCGAQTAALLLHGEGLSGVVGVSPGVVDFGLVPCGTTAGAQQVIVFNTGNVPFDFSATLGQQSPFEVSPTQGTVPASGSASLLVTPSPVPQVSQTTPNLYGDALTIATTVVNDKPHVIPIQETAMGAIISLSPASLQFGHQKVGTAASLSMTFTNAGNVNAAVYFTLSAPFSGPNGAYVSANNSDVENIVFTPQADALGVDATANLGLSTSAVLCAPLPTSVPLVGTAVETATAVSVGWYHACAIGNTGNAYCWGFNGAGQIGDGTYVTRYTPTQVRNLPTVSGINAFGQDSCAVGGGSVYCWGDDTYAQLGTTNPFNAPYAQWVSSLTNPISLGGGASSTCALQSGGDARCWGYDGWGVFGAGDNTTNVAPPELAFGGLSDIVRLAVANLVACVVRSGGTVECAGQNFVGQLGDGTTNTSNVLVTVSGLSSAIDVATTGGTSCALLSNGTVSCWGGAGLLGNGSTSNASIPVSVSNLSDATAVVAGDSWLCALRSGGGVVCWGDNSHGQLGDGTFNDASTPTTVSNLGNVTALAGGSTMTCALHDGGDVSCWGTGELGNGTAGTSKTPVSVKGFEP